MIFAPAKPIPKDWKTALAPEGFSGALGVPFLLYLLLSPLYLWASGLPQIADIILVAGIILFFMHSVMRRDTRIHGVFFLALAFSAYTVAINLINYQFLPDKRFLLSCLYYPFNALVFIYVAGVMSHDSGNLRRYAIWFIGAAVLWQLVWAIMVPQTHWREHGSFNNPNQLAYWSLLYATMIVMLRRDALLEWKELILIGILALFQMMALSKAGLITFALFLCFLFLSPLIGQKMRLTGLCVVIAMVLGLMLSSAGGQYFPYLADAVERLQNIGQEADDSLEARGYMRLLQFPEYVLLGAGEGGFARFDTQAKELHSGLATIIFSYGIMGAFLFIAFLYRVFARQPLYILLFFLPVILFGASGQNFRFPDFWVYLGIAYAGLFFQGPNKHRTHHAGGTS